MTAADDTLVERLVPLAERLVHAIHRLDNDAVAAVLADADTLADGWTAPRLLAVLCAGACIEDQAIATTLAWTLDPDRYSDLVRDGVPALLASMRAGRIAGRALDTDSPQGQRGAA